ncbi:hypothetical protein GQ457_09G024620 [Hibiscus cannabinus]
MKNFVPILFVILLFLAILEADGKRILLEKEHEPSDHQVDRNDIIKDDNSDAGLVVATQKKSESDSRHHFFPNETNPYFKPHRP